MIRRISGLAGRVSFRQLITHPRAELGRILAWIARRIDRLAKVTAHGRPDLPPWLRDEMIALASIEPGLLGSGGETDHYRHYGIPMVTKPGELYRRILAEVGADDYSHVLILPWLVHGGADRGALYHLQAWTETLPAAKILVLLSDATESPWIDRVPAGVKVVQFGRIVGDMAMEGRVKLLTRLLVQMQPAVIHTINSRVAWESFRTSGLALSQRSRLFASLFCDDHDGNMVPVGYARSYLRSCYTHLTAIFCDNTVYPEKWAMELGVPRKAFTVLRFPYDRAVIEKEDAFGTQGTPRVLWAGRFDRQKRPDILLAVARAMPTVGFDVHGVSVLGPEHPAMRALHALPNVTVHGPFARFEDIVTPAHVGYLFTTSWEGLPTILLDAAAAGLPIVAPAVGGIVDMIERAWLVEDPDDAEAFVLRLQQLIADPQLRRSRRRQQYAALAAGRAWSDFTHTLRGVEGYLPEATPMFLNISQQGSAK